MARIEVAISKSHESADHPHERTGELLSASAAAPAVSFVAASEPSSTSLAAAPLPPPALPPLPSPSLLASAYTTSDLFREFPDDNACLEYIKERVWPNGLAHCVKCGMVRKHYRVTGRKAYACNHCGRHIYPLAGTIFSKSTTPLRTWFYILYLMLSTRGLLSARQIQRETGVTYKTAWRSRGEILALFPVDFAERAASHPNISSEAPLTRDSAPTRTEN